MTALDPALVLVDGSSYLYRAFHALPMLTTSSGRNSGAAKGVINMIRRLKKDYPKATIAVVFDAKGKTFRDDIYPEYKANRPPMPDELREQIEPIHAIIKAMGLPLLAIEGVEADDVIGTLSAQAAEAGKSVLVSTGDKDMAQLVNEHVTLVNTMTDTVMDPAGVKEKFGLPPELIIDYLALMGDKVDNIPGVPGVGEKTALALLQNLGSLQDIYQKLDQIPELPIRGAKKLPEKLEAEREKAELSYELATIKLDVELPLAFDEIQQGDENADELLHWYRELEFNTWIDEVLAGGETAPAEEIPVEYDVVLDKALFEQWLKQLDAAPLFAFDTETTSLDYMQARVVGVSFAVEAGKAAYVPFGHDYLGAPDQLSEEEVLGALKPLLENPDKAKVGQNLKYDANVLVNHGITLRGISEDTMLQSYILDAAGNRHDMDSLALKYLGHSTVHYEDIAGKGAKQLTFNQIKIEEAGFYAAEDADITLKLHETLRPQVAAEKELDDVYRAIEMPLVPVLSRMERFGAKVDRALLEKQSQELAGKIDAIQKEAYEEAGGPFNLSSPKQLGEILFEKLELPVVKKTPKGAPSTAEEVLVELAHDYKLPQLILDYRGMAKLKSTYTDKLPQMLSPKTGRIHTSYHQAVAATGRLSSTDPNLQNIPIKTPEGRRIRQAFVAEKGYKLVAADYSQIELRIMAHLSGDEGLIKAFAEGEDIHRATAAEVFGASLDEVTDEQRRNAKAINFGLIYGMSAFGLARQLHIPRGEAQDYIDRYFDRYPGVAKFMDDIKTSAKEKGYVETLFGRRLYLPDIKASNGMRRQAAERIAINAPMQGTAADIIKRAMIDVDRWLENSDVDAAMIMQVHDELILEVAENEVESVSKKLEMLMANAAELSVPLEVGLGIGDNWDEAH
ncbi:DNA polymerase-1 [Litorivivens lipolytica]|uniref:DNA polymerase I n=1 Tax=Litorivivens lipolytica TaxID=1524264 RepID=A0A7W4Z6S3_9GAMM|nr:DNA polymerase I [Litorivivens lipolytica]MBB3048588.1 DNA polymerase-1 [Litorivivens lipolytica]